MPAKSAASGISATAASDLTSRVGHMEATPDHPVSTVVRDRIAVLTMERPEARNAINPAMRRALRSSMTAADADDDVDVIVLTGADPALCAGLDLKLLGAEPSTFVSDTPTGSTRPFPERTKPLIGAINGVAITGGFELALNCDFLIASEHAAFADTHARVGVMPGWGLTALLTDAVGRTCAREISLTGNFVHAEQALAWGLVNRVVEHDALMPTVLGLAADMVNNDQLGVRRMLATYKAQEAEALDAAWELEGAGSIEFAQQTKPGSDVEARRAAIMERGRKQL